MLLTWQLYMAFSAFMAFVKLTGQGSYMQHFAKPSPLFDDHVSLCAAAWISVFVAQRVLVRL